MDKIYIKDNYIVTELGGVTSVFGKNYTVYSENTTAFFLNSAFPINNQRSVTIDFSRVTSIYNEAGTVAYTTSTLRSFFLANTGFKSPVGGSTGITVGTTPITSGVDGRVLFQSGGVVSQDSGFTWDNVNKRFGTGGINISPISVTGSDTTSAINISQTWNTTGIPSLVFANVTDTLSAANSNLIDLQVNGNRRFSVRKEGTITFGPSGIAQLRTSTGGAFDMRSQATGNENDFFLQNNALGSRNHTSGTASLLSSNIGFVPTSGTGTYSVYGYSGIINQTGGANGITRGVYLTPVLTSAADWRSIEWANNTGRGLWGTGTASNAMAGSLSVGIAATPQARLDVRAQGALSTDIVFRAMNSAGTLSIIKAQGDGNVFVGIGAGNANTGANVSAFGINALRNNTSGSHNTAFGTTALFNITTAVANTAMGSLALTNLTSGDNNIAFGFNAGRYISSGANLTISNSSLFIGNGTRPNADNETNQVVIGFGAIGLGSNTVVLGNDSIVTTQLRGTVRLSLQASAPTGVEGAIYYDSTTKKHYGHNGTSWNALY